MRLAQRNGTRRRDRVVRRLPLFFAAVCAIGLVVMVFVPRRGAGWGHPVPFKISFSETGVTGADIAGFKANSAGEAAFARVILEATSDVEEDENTCLVYAWRSDIGGSVNHKSGGWPQSLVSKAAFRQTGVSEEARPITRAKWSLGHLTLETHWDGDRIRTAHTSISLHQAAPIVLALAVTWLGTGFTAWLAGWLVRRRSARRCSRGACVACGYDLKGLC